MKFERMATSKSNENGASYLRIEDNSNVTVVLRGEVLKFYQHWPEGGDKQIFDKPTPGAVPRFKINVVVFEDGKFVAKVWEFPPTVSNMLADIAESYDLNKTKIKISKIRQGRKVSYMVLPLAGEKDALTPKHLKEIEAVKLNILGVAVQEKPPIKNHAPGADDDEVPF